MAGSGQVADLTEVVGESVDAARTDCRIEAVVAYPLAHPRWPRVQVGPWSSTLRWSIRPEAPLWPWTNRSSRTSPHPMPAPKVTSANEVRERSNQSLSDGERAQIVLHDHRDLEQLLDAGGKGDIGPAEKRRN